MPHIPRPKRFLGFGCWATRKTMKRKNKLNDDFDDGKIGIDDYTDMKCCDDALKIIGAIIVILLIIILP